MEDSDPLFPPWKMDMQSQCKSTWQHGVSCLCAENAHVLWVTRSWLDPFPAHRAIQSHICTWASHETVESWNVYKLENKLLPIYKYIYIYIPMTTWLNCESDISSSHQRQGNYHHGLGPGPYCIQHNILRFFFFLFFFGGWILWSAPTVLHAGNLFQWSQYDATCLISLENSGK